MYIPKSEAGRAAAPELATLEDIDSAEEHAHDVIKTRAEALLNTDVGAYLVNAGVRAVYLAGGALMAGPVADLDVFPVLQYEGQFNALLDGLNPGRPDSQLAEVRGLAYPLQLCRHSANSVEDLVSGFDFAHCQVGVELHYCTTADFLTATQTWKAKDVYTSPHWAAAMMVQGTYYVGGKWPLRSLARVPKVSAKLGLSKLEAQALAMQVASGIVAQGVDAVVKADPAFAEQSK